MGLFLLRDGIHARFDNLRSKFYREGSGPKHKYHLVNWPMVCGPKAMGGLGLLNTNKINIALLLKWFWRLYQDEYDIWPRLITRAKYRDANDLFAGTSQRDSQFWKNLQKIDHYFNLGAKYAMQDASRTRFWLDWWIGDAPLKDSFLLSSLFVIILRFLWLRCARLTMLRFVFVAHLTRRACGSGVRF
jgi:hypothetical protein